MNFLKRYILYFFISAFLFTSCVNTKSLIDGDTVYTYECIDRVLVKEIDTLPMDSVYNRGFLLEKYNISDLVLANSFGLIPDLESYERLKDKIKSEGNISNDLISYIKYSHEINEVTDLAELEIQSLEDLISCSVLQLHKFKSKLSSKNNTSQNVLSNRAVFFGAITTVLTAGILLSGNEDLKGGDTFDWMAVGAGVATVYLARKSTRVDHKIELEIQNNFIKAILLGENENQLFSPSIWYIINSPHMFEEGVSLREKVIKEWRKSDNMLASKNYDDNIDLLVALEGVYNQDAIQLRIDLLDSLLNQLNNINHALLVFNSKK